MLRFRTAIATFIEKDISKGCPFFLYKAKRAERTVGVDSFPVVIFSNDLSFLYYYLINSRKMNIFADVTSLWGYDILKT